MENWLIVRELVEAGKGCAVVPGEILPPHNTKELIRINLESPEEPQNFYAVYRRELMQTQQGKALVASVRGLRLS
jgi:DNA-binding transcriptional LysR family regulator